jgi:coproporphyrinogen III oxidase-like Fe-S oxidoreductase
LLAFDGTCVRLTARGRMISNEVFQEFIGLQQNDDALPRDQLIA